jgi:hypothetical protein
MLACTIPASHAGRATTFRAMQGQEAAPTGWPDDSWRGWWGETPPYHVPVFVPTHHARPPLEMGGGTTFHFVTGGTGAALAQARCARSDAHIGPGPRYTRQSDA